VTRWLRFVRVVGFLGVFVAGLIAGTTSALVAEHVYDGPAQPRVMASGHNDLGCGTVPMRGCAPEAQRSYAGLPRGPLAGTASDETSNGLGRRSLPAVDPCFATNSAGLFGTHSADDLAASAASAGKGEYSAAGHALTKHAGGQRAGTSAFPSLSGNPANINQVAKAPIDDILATGRVVTRTHPNHGPIIEVFAPDGRGARWYADGRFFGFLEP